MDVIKLRNQLCPATPVALFHQSLPSVSVTRQTVKSGVVAACRSSRSNLPRFSSSKWFCPSPLEHMGHASPSVQFRRAQSFSDIHGNREAHSTNTHTVFDVDYLEEQLNNAVASEDYQQAARLRDEIQVLKKDSKAAILSANSSFYKAFENGDISAMRKIWSKGDHVYCIHPGAGCISGYDYVIDSWIVMFGPDEDVPLAIELHNVEVSIKGNMGFVTCLELVRTSGNNWGKQVATNIFEKVDGEWYICVHHASHVIDFS